MKIEQQKNIILKVANEHSLSSNVIEALFILVDENKHWRQKGENAVRLAFKRLVTYSESEQLKYIENAIIGQYRGLCWGSKKQTNADTKIRKLESKLIARGLDL